MYNFYMVKYPNIILIPPCNTYGDILSVISLMNYLKIFYEKVFLFFFHPHLEIYNFYNYFFEKNIDFNQSLFISFDYTINNLLDNSNYDEYHICNTHTGNWIHDLNNYICLNHPKINKLHYFCDDNPLFNLHKINDNHICLPNSKLPLTSVETNSIIYYKMVGLNNNVRMDYFHYSRNYEKEKEVKYMLLKQFNLNDGDKYNIVNTIGSQGEFCDINRIKKKINNNYQCIDINHLIEFPGWLFLLIEEAEELHLVEGLNVNFIYYSQYKNIINLDDKQIYLHVWGRNRRWENFNLDYSFKMFDNPKLINWNFIHDE